MKKARRFWAPLCLCSPRRSEGVYAEEETARLTAQLRSAVPFPGRGTGASFWRVRADGARLPAAYEFPREFGKIRPAAVQFLVDLCRPSQLTVGPFLRGFYFTGVRPVLINESGAGRRRARSSKPDTARSAGATGIFRAGEPKGRHSRWPLP